MDNDLNCNYDVTGINAQFGYNKPSNNSTNLNKESILNEIQSLSFAITELALYLNTHPTDEKALCLHKEYCEKLKDLEEKYQKAFGSLTINFPSDKWNWLNNPWPWERREI